MLISIEQTYYKYFQEKFSSIENMTNGFLVKKSKDKDGSKLNKTYLLVHKKGYYLQKDVDSMVKYTNNVNKIITTAKQVMIELEFLLEEIKHPSPLTTTAKILNISHPQVKKCDIGIKKSIEAIYRFILFFLYMPKNIKKMFMEVSGSW